MVDKSEELSKERGVEKMKYAKLPRNKSIIFMVVALPMASLSRKHR